MDQKRSKGWALGVTSMFRNEGLKGEKVTLLRRFIIRS